MTIVPSATMMLTTSGLAPRGRPWFPSREWGAAPPIHTLRATTADIPIDTAAHCRWCREIELGKHHTQSGGWAFHIYIANMACNTRKLILNQSAIHGNYNHLYMSSSISYTWQLQSPIYVRLYTFSNTRPQSQREESVRKGWTESMWRAGLGDPWSWCQRTGE
jgi:hypothetical protein